MSRMLTIISGAGIMVLVLIPVLFLHRYSMPEDMSGTVPARALLASLMVAGVTISGASALIVIRLFERFRG